MLANFSQELSSDWGGIKDDLESISDYSLRASKVARESLFTPTIAITESSADAQFFKNYESKQKEIAMKVLKVAFFLRFHKFNTEDPGKSESIVKNPLRMMRLHRRFPDYSFKLDAKLALACKQSFISCLYAIDNSTNSSIINIRFDLPTLRKVGKDFCGQEGDAALFCEGEERNKTEKELSSTSYCEDKHLEETEKWPTIARFRLITTAMYFMCWYTMHKMPYLANIVQCDSRYNCGHPNETDGDLRATPIHPFSCALHSFCPDPCCRLPFAVMKGACESLPSNPCRSNPSPFRRNCRIDLDNNRDFNRIRQNDINVTCDCLFEGYVYSMTAMECVDRDECVEKPDICDKRSESCFNTKGSYMCVCRWGFYREVSSGKCVKEEYAAEATTLNHSEIIAKYNASMLNWSPDQDANKNVEFKQSYSTAHKRFQSFVNFIVKIGNFFQTISNQFALLVQKIADFYGIELRDEAEIPLLKKKAIEDIMLMRLNTRNFSAGITPE